MVVYRTTVAFLFMVICGLCAYLFATSYGNRPYAVLPIKERGIKSDKAIISSNWGGALPDG